MSASASRRRSRAEHDLNYNSWNMKSFGLLPQKGPIKVLHKISIDSRSPISNSTKNLKSFQGYKKQIIKSKQIKWKLNKGTCSIHNV